MLNLDRSAMTLREFFYRHFSPRLLDELSPETRAKFSATAESWNSWSAETPIQEINTLRISGWRNALLDCERRGWRFADVHRKSTTRSEESAFRDTVNDHLDRLEEILEGAVMLGVLSDVPQIRYLDPPRAPWGSKMPWQSNVREIVEAMPQPECFTRLRKEQEARRHLGDRQNLVE